MSEICCTRLAEIQGATITQKWPSAHHPTICRSISSQLRHTSTVGKTC